MEAREMTAKPASTGLSIREQLQEEIEKAPNEEILAIDRLRISSLSKISLFSLFQRKTPLYGGINPQDPRINW